MLAALARLAPVEKDGKMAGAGRTGHVAEDGFLGKTVRTIMCNKMSENPVILWGERTRRLLPASWGRGKWEVRHARVRGLGC